MPYGALPSQVNPKLPHRLPSTWGFERYCLGLDGVDDHVEVPDDPTLDITGEITVMIWFSVKSLPFTGYEGIISRGSDTNRQYWIWGIDGESDISAQIGDTKWANGVGVSLQENRWYVMTLIGDPSGDIVFYLNLDEVARTSYGTAPSSESCPLYVGYIDTYEYLNGLTTIPLVYDRVLSEGEWRWNLLNYHNPVRDNLQLWLPMEKGTGATVYDRSGNGNDGSLVNGPTWERVRQYELRSSVGL